MIPAFPAIDARRKWRAAALWYAAFSGVYTFTGRFPLREPFRLPMWRADEAIPFWTWSFWVYVSQFLLLFLCFLGVRSREGVTRLVASISLASACAFAVFLAYPTIYPRGDGLGRDLSSQGLRWLYAFDSPANCFPSLHVALAGLSALCLRDERRTAGTWAVGWAALISLSTLTTKQHYVADVFGGLALLLVCRWLVNRAVSRSLVCT